MFVTFSSDAYENISYFSDVANKLISLMGHSATVPGAIKSENLSTALSSLQQGLDKIKTDSDPAGDDEDNEPEISLKKRAIPLIQMLQSAIKKDCDVLWDSSKSPG